MLFLSYLSKKLGTTYIFIISFMQKYKITYVDFPLVILFESHTFHSLVTSHWALKCSFILTFGFRYLENCGLDSIFVCMWNQKMLFCYTFLIFVSLCLNNLIWLHFSRIFFGGMLNCFLQKCEFYCYKSINWMKRYFFKNKEYK